MKNNDNKRDDNGRSNLGRAAKILAVAAGAAGAAAAGYYFYASKHAPHNRKLVARWATNFKDDVMKQARELEHLDRQTIVGIIDGVARVYEKMRGMNPTDLRNAANELKEHWQHLSAELDRGNGKPRGRSRSSGRSKSSRTTRRSANRTRTTARESEDETD